MKSLLATAALVLSAIPAHALELQTCDQAGVGLAQLVTPAGKNSRTFANSSIELFNVDTEEPAAASAGIAIVIPGELSAGGAQCFAVIQMADVDVMKAKATYDAAKGLLIAMETKTNDGGSPIKGPLLKLRVNLAKSTVTLEK